MNSKFLMLIFAISLFLNQSIFATNEPEGDMPTDYGIIAGRVLDQDSYNFV